jgi:hypothetical protein
MHEALRLFAALEPATTDWILSVGLERTIARNEAIAVEGQSLGARVTRFSCDRAMLPKGGMSWRPRLRTRRGRVAEGR